MSELDHRKNRVFIIDNFDGGDCRTGKDVAAAGVGEIQRGVFGALGGAVVDGSDRDVEEGGTRRNDVFRGAAATACRGGSGRGRKGVVGVAGGSAGVGVEDLYGQGARGAAGAYQSDRSGSGRAALVGDRVGEVDGDPGQRRAGEVFPGRAGAHGQRIAEARRGEDVRIEIGADGEAAGGEAGERVVSVAVGPGAFEGGAAAVAGAVGGNVARHVDAFERQRIRAGDVSAHGECGGAANGDQNRSGGAFPLHVTGGAKHLVVSGGTPRLRLRGAVVGRVGAVVEDPGVGERIAVRIGRGGRERDAGIGGHAGAAGADRKGRRKVPRGVTGVDINVHRRRRGGVFRNRGDVDVGIRVAESPADPEGRIVAGVGDAVAEGTGRHVQELRAPVAAVARVAAAATNVALPPAIPGQHQAVHEAGVGGVELAKLGPVVPFRVLPDAQRITVGRILDGGVELMDAVNAGAVHRPMGFGGQPADGVFERRGELTHAAAVAQQVEGVAIFAVASGSDRARRAGLPVVRVPKAEVVAEFMQQCADGVGLEIDVPAADPGGSAIGSDDAVPADHLIVVSEVVITGGSRQGDGMPSEHGVCGGPIGLVLDIPALGIGQHDQRRDRIGEIATTVAGL